MLITLRCSSEETFKIALLTCGEACGIEFGLIKGGPATRLTNANHHQKQHGQENGAAEVLLHEESSESSKLSRCEVENRGTINPRNRQVNSWSEEGAISSGC